MQQINSTTFLFSELGDVKPVVTIGGKSNDKFIPNVNNSFHNDEFFFNLNCIDDIVTDEQAIKTDGVISQTINSETHEYYIDDSGRLKWDKVFSACPDSMRVRFRVRKSAGVQFYYQPSPDEMYENIPILKKTHPAFESFLAALDYPDDNIGSYAVYCDKANNKYKTGKLCHIPRPFVIDASGKREWCVMTYEEISDTEGMLYIGMPENFMRNADYSLGNVRLDPVIGYTTAGSGGYSDPNVMFVSPYNATASSSGTASKVYTYLRGNSPYNDIQLGTYNNNAGSPGTLLNGPVAVDIPDGDPRWYSADVTGDIVSGSLYYPACKCQDNRQYFDNVETNDGWYSYSNMIDNPGSMGGIGWRYSLYTEYTESGGSGNSYYYQQQQM